MKYYLYHFLNRLTLVNAIAWCAIVRRSTISKASLHWLELDDRAMTDGV